MRMRDWERTRVICMACPWVSKDWSTTDGNVVKLGALAMQNFDNHEAAAHPWGGASAKIDGYRRNPLGAYEWASNGDRTLDPMSTAGMDVRP